MSESTEKSPTRKQFEHWYSTHAFNYSRDPIGSRDCSLQWVAWQAALATPPSPPGIVEPVSAEALIAHLFRIGEGPGPNEQKEVSHDMATTRFDEWLADKSSGFNSKGNPTFSDSSQRDRAYEEGGIACADGRLESECPYAEYMAMERKGWLDGWNTFNDNLESSRR